MSVASAFIALGGNLGDRLATLRSAVAQLNAHPELCVRACSGIYETSPVGPSNAPFLNGALRADTSLQPAPLLAMLHEVERAHGRERRVRWDARTLDLDLLLYIPAGAETPLHSDDPACRQPHPSMLERDFVLRPLSDLVPTLILQGRSVAQHLDALPPKHRTVLRQVEVDPPLNPG